MISKKIFSRSTAILWILVGYILIQFVWWEILLVRQVLDLNELKKNVVALTVSDPQLLSSRIAEIEKKKLRQVYMIVGEGLIFFTLLLFGIYRIKKSIDKEQKMNQQQKNLFLSITHELKTPVAAAQLQLQTLQKRELDVATRNELIGRAVQETMRLNTLIDDVLLASRLESNEYVFHPVRVDLLAEVNDIVRQYFPGSENYSISVSGEQVFCRIDKISFVSLITNLAGNAIKYSGPEPEVKIHVKRVSNKASVIVSDEGPGIPHDERSDVFKRFYRGKQMQVRQIRGTGLGLYIVKNIVLAQGGKIQIRDNAPRGTSFEIQFNAVD